LTAVPSSSVRVIGKAGAALGLGLGDVVATAAGELGATDGDGDAPLVHAASASAIAATAVATERCRVGCRRARRAEGMAN
jgi:hypothetical protein